MDVIDFLSYDKTLACAVFMLVLVFLSAGKALAVRQLHRLAAKGRLQFLGYPEQILDATRLPFIMGVALLAGVSQIDLSPGPQKWLHYAWVVILISQVALWANRVVTVAVGHAFEHGRSTNPSSTTHLTVAGLIARILLWTLAFLVALDNLGVNITTLVASLGVGGIAVALAVQNILGDIFSSVSIALDKPFVIDDYMGTVEYVGLKTTRIRSLGGEQIVFSNTELLKNRIRNFKRMQERRVLFEFGIAYETPLVKIKQLPDIVREIISRQPLTRCDRVHFKSYGDSALQFEAVYYLLSPDYNEYMDTQQAINLAMLQWFRDNGVAFAFPARTIYFAQDAAERKAA